jgi:surface antigen
VLGAVIGREIGSDMDAGDRGCVGHGLELMKQGQSLRWTNESSRVAYLLTPLSGLKIDGRTCRSFRLKSTRNGRSSARDGRACRNGDGTWAMM